MRKTRFLFGPAFLCIVVLWAFRLPVSAADVQMMPVAHHPRHVAVNPQNNHAVITHDGSDSVSIIDLSSRTVMAALPTGKAPRGIAIDRELDIAVIEIVTTIRHPSPI
ncbi:MAG: hypothetical protein M0C28_16975 [Candidatus Moduliflexus flocculans]|nr:hypothetical protein [Candidatus Moduliflexus flocculans]